MASVNPISYTDLYSQIQKGRGATDDPVSDLLLSFSNYLNSIQKNAAAAETEESEVKPSDSIAEKKELATQLYQQCLTLIGKSWNNDDTQSKSTLDSLMFLSNTLQSYKSTGDSSQLSAYLKSMNSANTSMNGTSSLFNTLG